VKTYKNISEWKNPFRYKGNANQKNIEIPSHPSKNGYHQEKKQQMQVKKG
jgi:hypothetical protein